MPKNRYLKLKTPEEVRKSINRVSNMLLNDEIDPKKANALIYACNAVLASLRTDEYDKRLEMLEDLLNEE